ncbi:unnamed protein product [Orchesella dallaii]|uniref:3-beta hydroxysteroid dehydrogenase/isomerase domain-containing protein n=1 Tax=Orchesella dallaii TaxID=48710 RepID=A0ABP1QB05_9HEXA
MSLSPALAPKIHQRVSLGPEEVILITGGSGFLGQHIIKLLNERTDGVREIRVVDIKPFVRRLEYEETIPLKYYNADIAIEDQLDEPFNGATCLIHCAAVVDVRHCVDRDRMRSVNIIGTTNVVFKARQWDVPKLILTSTTDAVIQNDSEFNDVQEDQTALPLKEKKFLMGYYAFTKAQAEALVICSRNQKMHNGKKIKTAILRPTVLYGEEDPYYVPQALRVAKMSFGFLPQPLVMTKDPAVQSTYVGNAAWAHILAAMKLNQEVRSEETVDDWQEVDGKAIYINDDTRPGTFYDFMKPFLALKGYSTLQLPIPFFLMMLWIATFSYVIQILPGSWRNWLNNKPILPTPNSFRLVHKSATFNRVKATDILEYSPIYSEDKALELSSNYYQNCAL